MRRLAVLVIIGLAATPAAAQIVSPTLQPPSAEVDCIAAGILAIVDLGRELTGTRDGGRMAISVTLQNRTQRAAAFVLNFTAPNMQMPAVNEWRTLDARERGTYLAGTLPRGTLVTDEELRGHIQLRCVR